MKSTIFLTPGSCNKMVHLFFDSAKLILFIFLSVILGSSMILQAQSKEVKNYLAILQQKGKDPIQFINEALTKTDLVIFDDAVHSAQEPFEFYEQLIKEPRFNKKVKLIFVEVFAISSQPYIDRYLSSQNMDSTLLYPVFQNDFSGYGWRYETYYSLLKTVWLINRQLGEKEKIRVIGVDQPIYWESLKTYEDYELFNNSLAARDYFMYLQIMKYMNSFNSGNKGIFLTNTRHAYTNLHSKDGKLIWNCGTFFRQWHPGKTLSIRIHNASLLVIKQKEALRKTAEGSESVDFRWVRMDNGKWDSAFALNGNKPVAFYLMSTTFGASAYIGNQMLGTREDQKMTDAYDALLFLGPLESLHFSATLDFYYTAEFKKELARRLYILYNGKMDELLKEYGQSTIEECINLISRRENIKPNNLIRDK